MKDLQRALRYLKPYQWTAIGAIISMLLVTGVNLVNPQILSWVIDQGIGFSNGNIILMGTLALVGIALVGETGAGKTTIVNLLARFYDTSQGRILVDDYDIRGVTQASLRSQLGIVLQDNFLFSGTIADNIRYGKREATDAEIEAVCRTIGLDGIIQLMEDGYQTEIGERDETLSQGQRQLISLARALLADPRILILDEATSNIDTQTEIIIQGEMDTLLKERTSFVIAHRLSTIREADQLLVLENGRIIERGMRTATQSAHEDLLSQSGVYAHLYVRQFRDDTGAIIAQNGHVVTI